MTRMTDLIHNSKSVVVAHPQAVATAGDVDGAIIDTQGFYSLLLEVALGETASSKVKIKSLKESDNSDMSGSSDVPESQLVGLAVGTDIATIKTMDRLNVIPTKRYVQPVFTTTTNGAVFGATAVLFGADIDGKINE